MVDHNPQFENPESADAEFETQLRQALQARSAPPHFAARVMSRIPSDEKPAPRRRPRIFSLPPAIRLAAVAALLIVILAGAFAWRRHQQIIAGRRARHQVMVALRITHHALQQVADNVSSNLNRKDLQP